MKKAMQMLHAAVLLLLLSVPVIGAACPPPPRLADKAAGAGAQFEVEELRLRRDALKQLRLAFDDATNEYWWELTAACPPPPMDESPGSYRSLYHLCEYWAAAQYFERLVPIVREVAGERARILEIIGELEARPASGESGARTESASVFARRFELGALRFDFGVLDAEHRALAEQVLDALRDTRVILQTWLAKQLEQEEPKRTDCGN